jgi:hypothetical protein
MYDAPSLIELESLGLIALILCIVLYSSMYIYVMLNVRHVSGKAIAWQ